MDTGPDTELPAGHTRDRLTAAAVELFPRHSFAGTSLQMIADELGFTKAAIYHHFRTRDQLLLAVLEPLFAELTAVVEDAQNARTVRGRADRMLTGYTALAVRHRALVAVLAADPGVAAALDEHAGWTGLVHRQIALLADVDPGPAGRVKAVMVLTGTAAATGPLSSDLSDDELHTHLLEAGRRTLGLRARRQRGEEHR